MGKVNCNGFDEEDDPDSPKCSICPLRGQTFVPSEDNVSDLQILAGTAVAIVGEAPNESEVSQGRPFVGPSGSELDKALKMAGIRRRDCRIVNCLGCRPPAGELRKLMLKINKENEDIRERNKERYAEEGQEPEIASPLDCCAPRLRAELAGFTNVITLGGTATGAVLRSGQSIMALRGAMTEVEDLTECGLVRKVMPTLHPSFVLRSPRWAHVFRNDIHKAARWFKGQMEWTPPRIRYNPSMIEILEFFSRDHKLLAFDLETDGIEPLTAKIRCVGIGTDDDVVVIGLLGKDGISRFYPPDEEASIIEILKSVLTDKSIQKVGQNVITYDSVVLESQWGITPKPLLDTMLLHRNVESELPHNLAYIVSMYTDAPPWKSDRAGQKQAIFAESDEALGIYCGLDTGLSMRILEPLASQVQLRDQLNVWKLDQKVQRVCADMHTVGMYVDQAKRQAEEKRFLALRYKLLKELRERLQTIFGKRFKDFKPGSTQQLRDLLFTRWQLEAPLDDEDRFTLSGDLSTADLILRSLITSEHGLTDEQREIIKLIRKYRKVQKVIGTYVVKMRPWNLKPEAEFSDLGWDDEKHDDPENAWAYDKETREKYGLDRIGIVNPATGRMYPGYSAGVAVTGRLSSTRPNAQNYPKALRAMITAQPGHVLVGADMDQLEFRIAAARWQIDLYLRAFAEGKDPHSMTAFAVFGEVFCEAAGIDPACFKRPRRLVGTGYDEHGKFILKSGEAYRLRTLGKLVQFSSQYEASTETVHKIIQKTEVENKDGTTELPYARLPLRKTREMKDNWLRNAPEFELGWAHEMQLYRTHGYIREPVTGRRRDFMDGENPQEISNYAIQSSAAGLMNLAIVEIAKDIPLHKWGPGTGIINQCHDAIVVECPENQADFVKEVLERHMNQTHPDLPGVVFSASADVGKSWKEV